jgi:hypothetical protein
MATGSVTLPSHGLRPRSALTRLLRFWSRHLLVFNVVLCAMAWFLYGDFALRGYGEEYLLRTTDFWLEKGWPSVPGIENVLLPGLAVIFSKLWTAIGFEFTERTFIVFAAVPYALFIYALSRHVRTHGGPVLAVAATLAMYTSGLIPYMASWGGAVDGLGYLSLMPAIVWPGSLVVFAIVAVLQCLNHYAGLVTLVLFAFVWHGLKALERERLQDGVGYWLRTFGPRAVVAGAILYAFTSFWEAHYYLDSQERTEIIKELWRQPAQLLKEVVGPFPWTLLSPLKLSLVPIVVLMATPLRRRWLRATILTIPLVAAAAWTFVFVDITRMAMFLMLPVWLATVLAAGGAIAMPAQSRRYLRRTVIAVAVLNLLIPNYYVNKSDLALRRLMDHEELATLRERRVLGGESISTTRFVPVGRLRLLRGDRCEQERGGGHR